MMTNKVELTRTDKGFAIFTASANGFESENLVVPAEWLTGENWLQGFPINVKTIDVAGEGQRKVVLSKNGTNESVTVYQGSPEVVQHVEQQVRNAWMVANGMEVPSASDAPQLKPSPALTVASPSVPASKGKTIAIWGSVAVVAVVLSVGGFFGAQRYLTPAKDATSIDLSSLSLDQLAQIDQNPKMVNSIQDEMMQAVRFGKERALSEQGKIPDEHLQMLESMGLDSAKSMQSAAACLSSM